MWRAGVGGRGDALPHDRTVHDCGDVVCACKRAKAPSTTRHYFYCCCCCCEARSGLGILEGARRAVCRRRGWWLRAELPLWPASPWRWAERKNGYTVLWGSVECMLCDADGRRRGTYESACEHASIAGGRRPVKNQRTTNVHSSENRWLLGCWPLCPHVSGRGSGQHVSECLKGIEQGRGGHLGSWPRRRPGVQELGGDTRRAPRVGVGLLGA